jgi:hypothetical protein
MLISIMMFEFKNLTDDKDLHKLKQESPIDVTEFEIVMEVNDAHPEKQYFPIEVPEVGMKTKRVLSFSKNKFFFGKEISESFKRLRQQ